MITSTLIIYKDKKENMNKFIQSSENHVIVLEKIDERDKDSLMKNLRILTFQDVNIEEKNDEIYVTIKCPPDKLNFFSKWIRDKYKMEN